MDEETQAHIEAAKGNRPAREPARIGGTAVVEVDPEAPPGVRKTQHRNIKAREALERSLDRSVPLEVLDGEDGPEYRVRTRCSVCREEIILVTHGEETDPEDGEPFDGTPSLYARAMVAGVVRRIPGTFICERCEVQVESEESKRQTEEAQRARLDRAYLPKPMHGFEFAQMVPETEERRAAIDAAREWANVENPEPRGLFLYGQKGTGKTRLAATAAWQRLRRWHLRWVSWPILLAELGASFDDKDRKERIKVLTSGSALVLDDIAAGETSPSDWERRQLFAAIDKRVAAGAPLLITSNLDPGQVGERLGEPIMSRIVGYSRVLHMPGEDKRLQFEFDGKKVQ